MVDVVDFCHWIVPIEPAPIVNTFDVEEVLQIAKAVEVPVGEVTFAVIVFANGAANTITGTT